MRVDAIIYDLDGTMIDTEEKVWCASNIELLGRRGISYNRDDVKQLMVGTSTREGMSVLQEVYNITGDLDELTAERREIILGLFDQVEYVDGFREFFASHKGLPAAIGTSMHREFFSRIDASLGMSKLVDYVTCIEDVNGLSKPDPAIFLHAAKGLGVNPEFCLVVEDAQAGIDAARSAGMHTIGLTRVFPDVQADFVVDSFAEIDLEKMGFELTRHSQRR